VKFGTLTDHIEWFRCHISYAKKWTGAEAGLGGILVSLNQGSFPAGTFGNGVPKVISTAGKNCAESTPFAPKFAYFRVKIEKKMCIWHSVSSPPPQLFGSHTLFRRRALALPDFFLSSIGLIEAKSFSVLFVCSKVQSMYRAAV